MNVDVCDVPGCARHAYDRVSVRKNYWFGEKIIKIDVCFEHTKAVLTALGFESEIEAQRHRSNQWRKSE